MIQWYTTKADQRWYYRPAEPFIRKCVEPGAGIPGTGVPGAFQCKPDFGKEDVQWYTNKANVEWYTKNTEDL